MKRTQILSAVVASAALFSPLSATAQTIINNNNNIVINNGGGNGGGRNNYDPGQAVNWRNDQRKLEAWLYTDRTNYRPGTGVQLRLTLTNLNAGSTRIQLPRNGEYAITITDTHTNRVIWSRDKSRSQGTFLQINAGGTAQWNEFWDQRDSRGNVVPMGAYRVDVRVLDLLPLSAQIFLSDRSAGRPQPGDVNGNGNGGIISPDPATSPIRGRDNGIGRGDRFGREGGFGMSPVRGTLTLDKTAVRSGDVVRFTYTVVNTSQEPLTMNFGSSQLFDVWVTPVTRTPAATRSPIWRLSDGVMRAQMMQQVSFPAGAQRVFQGTWRVGNDIASGSTLDVSASLTPVGSRGVVGAARTRIQVN